MPQVYLGPYAISQSIHSKQLCILADYRMQTFDNQKLKNNIQITCNDNNYLHTSTSYLLHHYFKGLKNPNLYTDNEVNRIFDNYNFRKPGCFKATSLERFVQLLIATTKKLFQQKPFGECIQVVVDAFDPICQIIPVLQKIFEFNVIPIFILRNWSFVGYMEYFNLSNNLKAVNQPVVYAFNQYQNQFFIQNINVINSDYKQFFINDNILFIDHSTSQNKKDINQSILVQNIYLQLLKNTYQLKFSKTYFIVKQFDNKFNYGKCAQQIQQRSKNYVIQEENKIDANTAFCIFTGSCIDEMKEFVSFQINKLQ